MSAELPGPHHCIGTARAVSEVVFRTLRTRCVAAGGSLSLQEIETIYSKIIESFSSGFDLFELRHHRCMDASLGTAAMPFARDKILATLLHACSDKAAHAAFSLQVDELGTGWINQFFDSLAHYIRQHIQADIDERLIQAYVDTAAIPGIKLTVDDLLKQKSIQSVLFDCVGLFDTSGAPHSIVKNVCDDVNEWVAGQRVVDGPNVCKITEEQTRRFLDLLPREFRITISAKSPDKSFAAARPNS